MRCNQCHEHEAVVQLTQIVNDQVSTLHLCEACAAAKGVHPSAGVLKSPLGSFLAAMGKGGADVVPRLEPDGCPACGATLQDFRELGKLGCATCWTTFEGHLRDLLRRLHGSTRHVGEVYAGATSTELVRRRAALAEVSALRDQLERAIAAENFELAAELRDRLRTAEQWT